MLWLLQAFIAVPWVQPGYCFNSMSMRNYLLYDSIILKNGIVPISVVDVISTDITNLYLSLTNQSSYARKAPR